MVKQQLLETSASEIFFFLFSFLSLFLSLSFWIIYLKTSTIFVTLFSVQLDVDDFERFVYHVYGSMTNKSVHNKEKKMNCTWQVLRNVFFNFFLVSCFFFTMFKKS